MGRRLGLLIVVAATTVAPSFAGTTPESGLRGLVLAQSRPVCLDDRSCLEPARGVVLVFRRNGIAVARTTTRATGTYRVVLPRGAFSVTVADRPRARLTPTTVHVVRGLVRRVDFELDRGFQ
jgi:hypothetical protein